MLFTFRRRSPEGNDPFSPFPSPPGNEEPGKAVVPQADEGKARTKRIGYQLTLIFGGVVDPQFDFDDTLAGYLGGTSFWIK